MTAEPRTEAGRRLDLAWPGSHLDRLDWHEAIIAIEDEADEARQRVVDAAREFRVYGRTVAEIKRALDFYDLHRPDAEVIRGRLGLEPPRD